MDVKKPESKIYSVRLPVTMREQLKLNGITLAEAVKQGADVIFAVRKKQGNFIKGVYKDMGDVQDLDTEATFGEELAKGIRDMEVKWEKHGRDKPYLNSLLQIQSDHIKVPEPTLRQLFFAYDTGKIELSDIEEITVDQVIELTHALEDQ